jgi:polyhydroxybutyrate depolymerase
VRLLLATLLVLALAAACRGGGSSSKPTETQPATDGPAATAPSATEAAATAIPTAATPSAGAAGCSPARPHASGSSRETIASGGTTREYLLEVPPGYTGSDALPLVLNFHGYGSNANQQAAYSGLPAKGDAGGFIVVTPQGSGGDKPFWNSFGVRALPDDVGFAIEMLNALEAQLCIDTARVFATGISNGASMSVRLACELSDRIAAVAGVAGVYFPRDCSPTRPVPVLSFHGTADPVVPYNGGPITAGISQMLNLSAPPEEDAIREWAQHNGCNLTPAIEQTSASVRHIMYSGCQEGANVELYSIDGGGHTWPGAAVDAAPDVLGPTTHEISATDLIWDFFVAHPMP